MGDGILEAEIAIVGGTGLYTIAELGRAKTAILKTPYGNSSELLLGRLRGRNVVFLARHGKKHETPPHMVNYRANIWALHSLGVRRVLATGSCGSINLRMHPGEFAVLSQFIDFTKRRPQTFYEGGSGGVAHIDVTEPYCPELRRVLIESAEGLNLKVHPRAVYACTEGPRFETAAEIRALKILGADLVGMTSVPECVLAREKEMCYSALGIITNFAAGISRKRLTYGEVADVLRKSIGCVRKLLLEAIDRIPKRRSCHCSHALEEAIVKT